MVLEVIATTLLEAVQASRCGVDRIELITGMQEGGLTPSFGLIEEVVKTVDVPAYIMVRPHSHSYCYDSLDVKTMLNDIKRIRSAGAQGIVLGVLTPHNTVDTDVLQTLLSAADGLSVTFHRAFDEVRNQTEAIHTLLELDGIERVLTSGGKANVFEACDEITHLLEMTKGSQLKIMAGSGLTIGGLEAFIRRTGIEELHFGKGVRRDANPNMPIECSAIEYIKHVFENVNSIH